MRTRSCVMAFVAMAFVLRKTSSENEAEEIGERHTLERIRSGLPFLLYFNLQLYTVVKIPANIAVYPELEDIAIFKFERLRLCVGG